MGVQQLTFLVEIFWYMRKVPETVSPDLQYINLQKEDTTGPMSLGIRI